MKKSTGIIFLVAAALAAFVYFYELKHNPPSETPGSTSKPAFSVSADDITGVTLERAGTTATFEHRPDGWYMLQPVATLSKLLMVRRASALCLLPMQTVTAPGKAQPQAW